MFAPHVVRGGSASCFGGTACRVAPTPGSGLGGVSSARKAPTRRGLPLAKERGKSRKPKARYGCHTLFSDEEHHSQGSGGLREAVDVNTEICQKKKLRSARREPESRALPTEFLLQVQIIECVYITQFSSATVCTAISLNWKRQVLSLFRAALLYLLRSF